MPAIHTPEWVKDAIFYQIFPDRFARSEKLQKPKHLEPWDSPPTTLGYKGGDLLGVVEHLDYLQELGVTALYFCPIFQSASNHRYHTHDYFQVDPLLGGNDAFRALLDETHRRGMRVVLDGVFNHASRGFFYFNDILENGRASAYLDWFTVNDFPPNAYDHSRPPGYLAWWNLHALPKLNTENPQVREYLMRVAEHWVRLGIDGWRLDVPTEIQSAGFWEEFRRRVKAINPETYIVGEIWREARDYLRGDRFDGVMNYLFAEAALAFAAQGRVNPKMCEGRPYNPARRLDAYEYADRVDYMLGLYPAEIEQTQLNLLDSHDTARAITLASGDKTSVQLATLLLMTFPGAPSIFYGDEIGLEGGLPDTDTRRTFPWDRPQLWQADVLAYHRDLIALRKAHSALRRGAYRRLLADGPMYAFGRTLESDRLLIVVNAGEEARTVSVPVHDLWPEGTALRAAYGQGGAVISDGCAALTVPARSGVVLA